ncbi:MAG: HNH endonuclease [Anaerotignum sp.]
MVTVVPEEKEQQCVHCGTIYEYVYNRGWGYDIKGHRTKKCIYCKSNIFVPVPQNEDAILNKIECPQCHKQNITRWSYNSLELIPCDTLITPCAWCNEKIEISISETTSKWLTSGKGQYQENAITCPHCKRGFKILFAVGDRHPVYEVFSRRLLAKGRKKKVTENMLQDFLEHNSIYQTYSIIHLDNVFEYCEQNHIDEEAFFDVLEKKDFEIFEPVDLKDIDISLYESEFPKLKLKEDAMSEAGGASLSGLLGKSKAWKDLRKEVLKERDYTCEICGYKTTPDNAKVLHVHEEWEQEQNIVTLKNVSLICSRCHACKHRNQFIMYRVMGGQNELVDGIPRIDLITIHLMRVNKVSKEVIYAYRKKLYRFWEEKQKENIKESSTFEENGTTYIYRIEPYIPNCEAIIKALQKKELY